MNRKKYLDYKHYKMLKLRQSKKKQHVSMLNKKLLELKLKKKRKREKRKRLDKKH